MKKKNLLCQSLFIALFFLGIFILNIETSYYQGVNYEIKNIKIPLYLKLIDFFSRDSHYKMLTREIIKNCPGSDKEKAMCLLEWTYNNIHKNPGSLPIIDDHVWHIIIRGYGEDDQFNDVFTTLCNYAGVEAFFTWVDSVGKEKRLPFSFVKVSNQWVVFDPYRKAYFIDENAGLAEINKVKQGKYLICAGATDYFFNYLLYTPNIPLMDTVGFRRSNTQSPVNRLFLQLDRWKKAILMNLRGR